MLSKNITTRMMRRVYTERMKGNDGMRDVFDIIAPDARDPDATPEYQKRVAETSQPSPPAVRGLMQHI